MTSPEEFAAALRRERVAAGLSQSALARLADVEPSYIAHLEAGRRLPSVTNLCAVANALGVSLDRLFMPARAA